MTDEVQSQSAEEPKAAEPAAAKTSLLGGMKSSKPAKSDKPEAANQSVEAKNDSSWMWQDGVPGMGERPSWLSSKYKSVADQAKSQVELEKMLGATAAAPDKYDLGELGESIDFSHPALQELVEKAKHKRINNDTFKDFTEAFINYSKVDFNKEIEKLGEDGPTKINTVKTWAENNLSEKALQTIGKIAMSADAIEMLDELRQLQFHSMSQPPSGSSVSPGFVVLTKEDVKAEMAENYERYKVDAKYREEISRKMEQAIG